MTANKRPEPGTPEFEKWLAERAKKHLEGVFSKEAETDEPQRGLLCGDPKQFAPSPEESAKEDVTIDQMMAKAKRHLRSVE